MSRTKQILNIQPLVRRDTDLVVGWICRVHLAEGDQQIYEDYTYPVPEAERKPLAAWASQRMIRGWLEGRMQADPRLAYLGTQLDGRLLIDQRMDFNLASLPE